MMNRQDINARIEEYRRIRPDAGSSGPSLAEAALFVEEVFGLTLTDDEISPDNLGSSDTLEQFVLAKLRITR